MLAKPWRKLLERGEGVGAQTMSGLFSRVFGTKSAALKWFDVADVQSRLGNVLLVDVREPQ